MKLKHTRGKRKANAIDRLLRWQAELVGWRIAAAIRASVDGPEAYCDDPHCRGRIRYQEAVSYAAFAEDVAAGRTPDITPEPPCSAAVLAAEAKLGAPLGGPR